LNTSKVGQNFHAIKIGDVNASATINAKNNKLESRSSQKLVLYTDFSDVNKGQSFDIPIYAGDFNDVLGYQFTLEYDANLVAFDGLDAGRLAIDESNFGLHMTDKGIITTSWHSQNPTSIEAGTLLFTIQMKAKANIKGRELMKLSSKITPALSYDVDYNASEIVLENRNQTSGGFELKQNMPNPFNESTVISFVLPDAAQATITVTDVTGKVIKVINGEFPKGESNIKINVSEVNSSGVLFYRIDSGKYSDTKKMILIE
jgi:hypothetical protein